MSRVGDKLKIKRGKLDSQWNETAKVLKSGIKDNLEEKWWLKKEYQPTGYQDGEIERAMNKILQIFDNRWVEDVLDQRKDHLVIESFKKGSYNLSMLVGLGNDLIEIESLKNSGSLIKDIKNGTKFISAAFEAEIAAECVKRGFDVELYPVLCRKTPDLKIIFDSKVVYFEITEIHPSQGSQGMHTLHETLDNLFGHVNPLIPENTSIKLTPNKLISNSQFNPIKNRLEHILKDNSSFPTSFQINDLIVEIEKEKDDWGKGLYITIPPDMIDLELKRLNSKIKKKARQICEPNLGVIVVDATNTLSSAFSAIGWSIKERAITRSNSILGIILSEFVPMDKTTEHKKEIEVINKIKDNIKEIFEQSNYSNILAVIIIRSFKFFKNKNEMIIVKNPYREDSQLLNKIKELHTFSRTTYL
jgi:hypothetical protein